MVRTLAAPDAVPAAAGRRYDPPIASRTQRPPARVVLFVVLWLGVTAFLVFERSPSCTFAKITSGDHPGSVCSSVDRPKPRLEVVPTAANLRDPVFIAQGIGNVLWFALPAFVAARRRRPGAAVVAVVLIAFSAFVEVTQALAVDYRRGSVVDFACNIAGVLLGWGLAIRWSSRDADPDESPDRLPTGS